MKAFNHLFGVLTITAALGLHTHAQTVLTNGLVAHYPFNGNANNAAGNRINGTVVGATLTTNRFGETNSAYRFVSEADFIDYGNPQALSFKNAFSLSAWINPLGGGGLNQMIAVKEYEYQIALRNGALACALSCEGRPELWSESMVEIPTKIWTQVMIVYDGAKADLFTNGISVASFTLGGPITNSSPDYQLADFRIGASQIADPTHNAFSGAIDDVRIYNRALSAAEVQQLYQIESGCIPRAATATATVVNGFVVGVIIIDPGCGYTDAPAIRISGGGGTGAEGVADVSNGVVTSVTITDAGIGYTNAPTVKIASPPFRPWLELKISKVKVTQHVVLGRDYILESSTDTRNWSQVGEQFTAEDEVIAQEFDVDLTGRFFRIRQVP